MLDLQNTESAQSAQLAAIQISDSSQNTAITTLQSKTQNISSADTTSTNFSKPLYVTGTDAIRMYGNISYISGWNTQFNTIDWFLGREHANIQRLVLQNLKAEEIYLKSGSTVYSTNLGTNKIVTHSGGIQLKRGGLTAGDTEITLGEIGAVNPSYVPDATLYINGNGTNNIAINSGIGATVLDSNAVWIGSGSANANGRKSNINMLDATGTWETQSSAFTETLKARLLQQRSFNNTGKVEMIVSSFWWLGFAYNLTTLIASRTYNFLNENFYYGAEMSVGSWLNLYGGYGWMFDATGAYLLNDTPNLSLIFEMEFTAGFSLVTFIYSKVTVKNNAGTVLSETFEQGTYFNGAPEQNARTYRYYYLTAPLRHILNQGDRIFVNTKYSFITPNSNSISGTTMRGKFSIHAN